MTLLKLNYVHKHPNSEFLLRRLGLLKMNFKIQLLAVLNPQ